MGRGARNGLFGAPAVRVVASEERHATIDRSLRLLGLGAGAVEPVATDVNGAIDVTALGIGELTAMVEGILIGEAMKHVDVIHHENLCTFQTRRKHASE